MKKTLLLTAVASVALFLGACEEKQEVENTTPAIENVNETEIPVVADVKQTISPEINFTGIKYSNVKVEELKPKLNAYLQQTAEDLRLTSEMSSQYIIVSAEYEILGEGSLDWEDMHNQYIVRDDGYKVQVKGEIISSDIYEDAGYESVKPIYWGIPATTKGKQYFVFSVGKTLINENSEWFFTASKLNENTWANEKISIGKIGGK